MSRTSPGTTPVEPRVGAAPMRGRLAAWLAPEPPRRIPGHRWLGVVLRTVHIVAFGVLLGGHAFEVEADRLVPFLALAIASGVALALLELAATCAWLLMGKGLAVLLKLGILGLVPVFWEQRLALVVLTVIVASVAAHMPSRLRHASLLDRGRAAAPAAGVEHGAAPPGTTVTRSSSLRSSSA
jgi:hypothetical protein